MIVPPPLPQLADALRRLAPSCGVSRLVAVDGHAGSGKSTFAARLSAALDGAPVLPLDLIASHAEPFAWTERLRHQVLDPLSRAEPARWMPYDWHARTFGPPRTLPPAPVLLVEGVGAGRAALRPWLARLLWMELAPEEAWRRGRHRDGPALAGFWDGWTAAERAHFAADPSRPFAHRLVRQSDRAHLAPAHEARTDAAPAREAPAEAPAHEAPANGVGARAGSGTPPGPTWLRGYEVVPGPAAGPVPDTPADETSPKHHSQ